MKKYLLIIFVFIDFGCEMVVDIDIPFHGGEMVVNSVFNPDSLWLVEVSTNRPVLNTPPAYEKINDALVIVYQEGKAIDTLGSIGRGLYRSDSGKPVAGKTYELKVSSKNYKAISATSQVPTAIEITDVKFTTTGRETEIMTTFDLKFQDPPQQKNFYDVIVMGKNSGSLYSTWGVESLDPSVGVEFHQSGMSHFLVKDVLFEGKETVLSFQSNQLYFDEETVVILRSVSEDYYRYYTTLKLQIDIGDDPLSQPLNVYKNIDGGYGIFGGYSQSVINHDNKKPTVLDVSPLEGRVGDHVLITGKNLTPFRKGGIQVYFFNAANPAQVVQATDELIEVVVPPGARTGRISVSIDGRYNYEDSEFVFEVLP